MIKNQKSKSIKKQEEILLNNLFIRKLLSATPLRKISCFKL